MKSCLVAAVAMLMTLAVWGQETRGTISGALVDSSGAGIPGVKVIATETRTGTKASTVSDTAGQYTIPFLAPGNYEVSAEASGFKKAIRSGLDLGSGGHPVVDLHLEVGDTAQSVEVAGDVPLLNTENASTGQTITTRQVEDFPLNGRTPMMLAQLAIGVIATGAPSLVHPFDNSAAAAWSIAGTAAQTSELLIDGAPNATWDNRVAYNPPQDAVQQVTVNVFESDATYGHTGAGVINQVMKTGTNSFHGSLYEFNQVSALEANNFFNNQKGLGNPLTHFNQYGASVGGPVWIPKLFNGKNRLFWFFAWENLKDAQPSTIVTTVPTDAEKMGNFSAYTVPIYDPNSATLSGSTVTRTAFPGNIIPTSRLNPISLAYMQYYPEPNITPLANGFDNFGSGNVPYPDNYSNELGRIDYNMSNRSRLAFNVRHNHELQKKNNDFDNIATGTTLLRENWGASADEVYTFTPTTILDLRVNFTRLNEVHGEPSEGFNPTTLGYPSYISATSQYLQLPYVGYSGSCGSQSSFQCLGDTAASKDPSQSLQLFADVVKIVGTHAVKFGFDARQYRLNVITYGNSAGTYTFANNWTKQASTTSTSTVPGQDLASMLLGLPTAGEFDLEPYASFYSYYYGGFVQDDWRLKRNLTINLGLRYDHDLPYSEKYARAVNGFDTTAENPVGAAAKAAYAAEIPAGGFNVPGGLTFASQSNREIYQNSTHLFSPRAGFAWSPDLLKGKTVIRGGFGLFVAPVTVANLAITGAYSSNPIVDQEGFSQVTQFPLPSTFQTPITTISNPFPTGIQQPVGAAAGLQTFLGQTISFLNPKVNNPYSERWNFGFQQTLSKDTVLEIVYIGNHGVHLPIPTTQLNVIPRQYLSTLPVRDTTLINTLTASVANPFAGLIPSVAAFNGAKTTVAQLLAAYPEFPVGSGSQSTGVIEQNADLGSSFFESLNVRVEKRLSHGINLIGNYIRSKLIEEDSWLNDTDLSPEKRISPFDHPNHFVLAAVYELPVGRGKPLNLESRWANAAFGGWVATGIYTFQTGQPINWVNGSTTTPGDYIYYGGNIDLNPRGVAGPTTPAFNTSVFDTASATQLEYHIRTFSTTFPNLRQDGINNFDTSLLKRFSFTERMYLQLRLEAFNVVNHPTFAAPNAQATSASFGIINTQANRPRTIQIGARFVF
jgi:Carboxypeptidase regulatory-like domain